MPVSTIDSATALVVVDLQKGIARFPTAHPMAVVAERAGYLARAFRDRGLPVVLVNVAGIAPGRVEQGFSLEDLPADFLDFLPELDQQPSDLAITKTSWGAFTGTGLEEALRGRGVTQVVVVGVATSAGVESTARQAYELGFNVALALDAMTDMDAEAHANSAARIFPRIGETGSAQDVIDRLA